MKRKYEEQDGLTDSGGKSARKPRKSSGIRVSVNSTVIGGTLIPQGGMARKDVSSLYGNAVGQSMQQYTIMGGSHQVGYPHQPQYHRAPMSTWNPPVYNQQQQQQQQQQQETVQWSNQVFKQETFKVEPIDPLLPDHNYNENTPPHHHQQHHQHQQQQQQHHQHQQEDPEFQHLFSPLK